ncbi:MAG: riboflavin synthase, partial [Chitinophagaceae bacterium]
MFTGIIEAIGRVSEVRPQGSNLHLRIESPISALLKKEESVAHNGVCLTVTDVNTNHHQVTAIAETLLKSNLKTLRSGDRVNLERAMLMNSRLDGHLVQGHIDCTGKCLEREEKSGSWEYRFSFPKEFTHQVIEKGSI